MGPFPHDAPPATVSPDNPVGTDGFEFVEFAHPRPEELARLFTRMGYAPVARHKTKNISVYRQGDINYVAQRRTRLVCDALCRRSWPLRGLDGVARRRCQARLRSCRGARRGALYGADNTLNVPAIKGIGGSLLYFIDRYGAKGSPYAEDYDWLGEVDPRPKGVGFYYLDHLTHNVNRGNMDKWFGFYTRLFNFRQIRFFDIEGKHTGLFSRALTSPCGRIRIPINKSADDQSQIEEYLRHYKGEGIQHIAVGTDAIYDATDALAANGLQFMPAPPDAYYEKSFQRVPATPSPSLGCGPTAS